MYTVASHLASPTRNPEGGAWLTGALLFAVLFLWPATHHLARAVALSGGVPRASVLALRIGLAGCAILALEGLTALDLSRPFRKGHEAVALVTFFGFYGGVLGLCLQQAREAASSLAAALAVALPLLAVGITQLTLYVGQRDLEWVTPVWREVGVPVWLSFAFWQWLAVLLLVAGTGYVIWTARTLHRGSEHEGAAGNGSTRS